MTNVKTTILDVLRAAAEKPCAVGGPWPYLGKLALDAANHVDAGKVRDPDPSSTVVTVSAPFRDRCLVVEVPALDGVEREAALADVSLRRARTVLRVALGIAVTGGRDKVEVANVRAALAIVGASRDRVRAMTGAPGRPLSTVQARTALDGSACVHRPGGQFLRDGGAPGKPREPSSIDRPATPAAGRRRPRLDTLPSGVVS